MIVKVNTVVIPGINDSHVVEVARRGRDGRGHPQLHAPLPCGRNGLRARGAAGAATNGGDPRGRQAPTCPR